MNNNLLLGLLQNGAILLAFSVVYDFYWVSKSFSSKVVIGSLVGLTTTILMLTPWTYVPGITFDTRSIVLGLSGLFFGTIPTLIAMVVAAFVRYQQGGSGIWMGLTVILTSGTLGIIWRCLRERFRFNKIFFELIFLGIIIHVVMLFCTNLLPATSKDFVLKMIFWPTLTFYPALFVFVGLLMQKKSTNLKISEMISKNELMFRGLAEVSKEGIIVLKNNKIAFSNNSISDFFNLSKDELKGKSIEKLVSKSIIEKVRNENSISETMPYELELEIPGRGRQIFEFIRTQKDYGSDNYEFLSIRNLTKTKENERALEALHNRNNMLISTAMNGLWIIDMNNNIVDVNESYCKLTGYNKEEIIGKKIQDFDKSENQESLREKLGSLKQNQLLHIESQHITKYGKYLPVEINIKIIDFEGGLVVAFIRDLSEILTARQLLLSSERRYRELFEQIPDGIAVISQGIINFCNQSAARILGYDDASQTVGLKLNSIIVDENPADSIDWDSSYLPSEIKIRKAKDSLGNEIFLELRFTNLHESNINLVIFRNITSHINTNNKLIESEERFRLAFYTSPDSVNINRLSDGKYVEVNDGFMKMSGFTRDEVIGKTSIELGIWAEVEDREKLQKALQTNKTITNLEANFRLKDGSIVPGLMSATIIQIKGEPHIISITREITELKRKEIEINELNNSLEIKVAERTLELENLNRELEAFSYSISHDLKAPLRHISGFAEILFQNENLDIESKKITSTIISSAKRMAAMIDSLINFSKLGKKELSMNQIDPNKVVNDIIKNISIDKNNPEIEWSISTLPIIHADHRLIINVFENILGNAVKFSLKKEKPKIAVSASIEDESIIFLIEDNGAGFDMKYVGKLFNVFQRLHKDDEFEGTGIGLANVKKIIEKHGGKIWIESEINLGTKVYIKLPKT